MSVTEPVRRAVPVLVGASVLLVAHPALHAVQEGTSSLTVPAAPSTAQDSARALDDARDAQRRFERLRRRRLTRTWGDSHRCDEIVGRYCLWHDDLDREAPPEDPEVTEARDRLLTRLEAAATTLPGDGWVAGQRVRYLVEAGRPGDARRVAHACRASMEWCLALQGYALHAAGEYPAADSAFHAALSLLPPEERCRWRDLSPLLDGDGEGRYHDLRCGDRGPLEEALWRLADPLWGVPGNDRRTEHFARHVMDRMQRDAASGYGTGWGDDLGELLVRYGWPAFWEIARGGAPGPREESVVAHDPPGSRRWLPTPRWAVQPLEATPDAWELEPRRPRGHYAPAYLRHARSLRPPDFQLAAFRRPAGVVVAGAWDARPAAGDTLPPCDSAVSLLGLEAPDGRRSVVWGDGAERGRLLLDDPVPVDGEAAVAGIERFCPRQRSAVRARFGHRLPAAPDSGPSISDLLVLEDRQPLPDDLEEAAAAARHSLRARAGERIGLYWELYLPPGAVAASPRVAVRLRREGKGLFRRIAEWVGLAGERTAAVGLEWRERMDGGSVAARSVALTLPPGLDEGVYRLEVEAFLGEGRRLQATRALEVTP